MKKVLLGTILILLSAYCFLNLPICPCNYHSSNGEFSASECHVKTPTYGENYQQILLHFQEFEKGRVEPDIRLFRSCQPDWSNPLRWWDYWTHPRWQLEYQDSPLNFSSNEKSEG